MSKILKRLKPDLERCIIRFFASWCFVNFFIMLTRHDEEFTNLSYARDIGLPKYILFCLAAFILMTAADALLPVLRTDGKLLLLSVILLSFKTVSVAQSYYYTFFLLIPIAIMLYYLIKRRWLSFPAGLFRRSASRITKLGREPILKGSRFAALGLTLISVAALGIFFSVIVAGIGINRYRTFSSPNYDFGIFCNMFHNMKTTLLPTVSSERDAIMSHFAVHISPVYYLLLPFYALFPSPLTLQIGQAAVLASGLIPLYFICRKYELKKLYTVLILTAYILYPALSGGTFYDIHENCFLTPLLLWTFYFFEKEKYIPMYISVLLTLTVKEDAAIFIAFFALYILLGRKKYLHGIVTFVGACLYFGVAVLLITKFGDGVLAGRFGNYIIGDEGFIGVLKTVIFNPGYVFTQFAEPSKLAEKLLYILQMLAPLAFIPFLTKKISRYLLVFPFILINLMPVYIYQFNIGFQYNFANTAFFFWLLVMNISDMRPVTKRFAVSFCALASALVFTVSCLPMYTSYAERYEKSSSVYDTMDAILDGVDKDASVTCSTFLLAHLADRSEIYELAYHDFTGENAVLTDYVIIDARYSSFSEDYRKCLSYGYVVKENYPNMFVILELADRKNTD